MIAAEFYDKCAAHDWFYDLSDDQSVGMRGECQRKNLVALANESVEFLAIFNAWQAFMFSGPAFGTPKNPKPDRPAVSTFDGDVPSVHPEQMELSI